VLPLLRKPLVASALIAGAVAPDVLYVGPAYRFATMHINGNLTLTLTHEFSSAFWLDPLLALAILLVFHLVVKRPLLALAPESLAGRLPSPSVGSRIPGPVRFFWIVVSTVIGAFTHVLWDSFTHGDGYFVRRWAFLSADLTGSWDVNRALQYVSSVGGILILLSWLAFWWRRTTAAPIDAERYLPASARYAVLAAAALLGVATAVVMVARAEEGELFGEAVVRLVLTGAASGVLLALAAYVVIWQALRLRHLGKRPVSAP
jgi:hypothetical protein